MYNGHCLVENGIVYYKKQEYIAKEIDGTVEVERKINSILLLASTSCRPHADRLELTELQLRVDLLLCGCGRPGWNKSAPQNSLLSISSFILIFRCIFYVLYMGANLEISKPRDLYTIRSIVSSVLCKSALLVVTIVRPELLRLYFESANSLQLTHRP